MLASPHSTEPRAIAPRAGEVLVIAALFTCLAVVTTYPLILELTTSLPGDLGDPLLSAWTLAWDALKIRTGLRGVWNAPNFFPYARTLLYSDHLLGIAVFTAPLQWLTGNPVLVYNMAFLGSVVFSGVTMYLLTQSLVGSRTAAFPAGIIYATLPFRVSHLSHLQWLVTGWLPFGLWALHRYFSTVRRRYLALAAACFYLQGMTATYFFYFAVLPFAVVAIAEWARTKIPVARVARHLLPVALVMGAAIAPVAGAYGDVRRDLGFRRTADEIASQSADVADYFRAPPRLRVWGVLGTAGSERELFPGAIATILAIVGIATRPKSRTVVVYSIVAIAAFVLSLGPAPSAWRHSLSVPGPYAGLLLIVPGLDGMRAVARLGFIVSFALTVLASFGAAWVFARVRTTHRLPLLAALVAGITLEGLAAPIPTAAVVPFADASERSAYEYLRQLPSGGVFELPTSTAEFTRESLYQYRTLMHGHAVVNGFSGYASPLAGFFASGQSPLNQIDRLPDAIRALRAANVRYFVLHWNAIEDPAVKAAWESAMADRAQVTLVRRFGDTSVAALLPPSDLAPSVTDMPIPQQTIRAEASQSADRLPLLLDGNLDTRWISGNPQSGDEWIKLAFDKERDVAMVRIWMAQRSLGDYPRELTVESLGDRDVETLFRGSVLTLLTRGLLENGDYPVIDIAVPPNRSRAIRLRQLGTAGRFFWSVHELEVRER